MEGATGNVVLSRRPGRAIYIGRGVTVTVVSVSGQEVELAVEAPQDVAVTRDDYSFAVHLEYQKGRERGVRLTADQARELAVESRRRGSGG